MAQQTLLSATPRARTGKGAARSLRRAGKVPAVIYGHGREPEPLEVDAAMLGRLFATGTTASTVVDVTVEGREPVKAIIREVQRNPIRPSDVLHLDLYEIHADEQIIVEVAVRLVGVADGVRNFAGVMDHSLRMLEIRVFPADIPGHIDLDVTALGIGDSIHVRDVVLDKVEILNDPDQTICSVVAPRVEEVATPVAEPVEAEPELIRKLKVEGEEGDED